LHSIGAGRDLLETHFVPRPGGVADRRLAVGAAARLRRIDAALLAEMGACARRLTSLAIKLAAPGSGAAALPRPARAALVSACQWLRIAETATWAASQQPAAAAGRALLHAVPTSTPHPRHRGSWQAWRAVARAWDSITTGTTAALTPLAAEISGLVLRAGRLAHHDPACSSP
jgi:hypothetical protein